MSAHPVIGFSAPHIRKFQEYDQVITLIPGIITSISFFHFLYKCYCSYRAKITII